MGRFACIAGLLALSRLAAKFSLFRLVLWGSVLFVSFVVVIYSVSRTAILGFGVAAAFLLWINRRYFWMVLGVPLVGRYLYMAWFQWRYKGSMAESFVLSGRQQVWQGALEMSLRSPLFGFGFHADRLLLEGEHVHMAYLHAMIQSGIVGAVLFIMGFLGIWVFIVRNHVFRRMKTADKRSRGALGECLAILAFLTVRSFFESTAAFYGVDLLIFIPVTAYVFFWTKKQIALEAAAAESVPPGPGDVEAIAPA
jgi:O-antigen ligase